MPAVSTRLETMQRDATADPEAFWARAAGTLPWHSPWTRVFEWDPERPDDRGRYFRWFIGAETNLAWNCVDRHVQRGRGAVPALICEDERGGRSVLTYAQLQTEVRRTAGARRVEGQG